jgi:hypothetical protein
MTKIAAPTVLPFPCASDPTSRRGLMKNMQAARRRSEPSVIVDLSSCDTLNQADIDLLLECLAEVAGRDTRVLFVAGSHPNRLLLEVTRIASLAPVFLSMEEALAHPQTSTEKELQQTMSQD